jgi:hypothetical protein
MATTINAGTATGGAAISADTTGILQLQSGSTPTTAITINASQNVGIGTSSPNLTSSNKALTINSSAASDTAVLELASAGTANCFLQANNAGTYFGNGGAIPLQFYTNSTERMRIDSAGNVGIGTSSPNQKLESTGTIRVSRAGTPTTYMEFFGGDGSIDPRINVPTGFGIPFNVGGSEKARIDSSGNLLVGTTSIYGKISSAQASAGGYCIGTSAANNAGTYYHAQFTEGGTLRGQITSNGTLTTYSTTSDYRLKENVIPMTGALEKVSQLKPVTYKWKTDGSDGQGFIAHELQSVVPECVVGEKDAVETVDDVDAEGKVIGTKEVPKYQGIDTSFLVATLTAAIQELNDKVDAQAAEIQALKGAK